jgi:Zn-dependent metalloprotease
MKKLLAAVILMTATAAFGQFNNMDDTARMERTSVGGGTEFIKGRLGKLGAGRLDVAAKHFIEQHKNLLNAEGSETFEPMGQFADDMGQTHVRLQQHINGLPVVGAEFIVHTDADRNVFAMNGRFTPDRDLPREATLDGWSAIQRAADQMGIENGSYAAWPELMYVVNERGNSYLAWRVKVAYTSEAGEEVDYIFANARTGDLVLRQPQIQRARNRATYNGNNTSTLPGTLVLTETGGSTSDTAISTAHGHAGTSYDYYSSVHGRDSYNNAGAQIKTTVHHRVAYNNAFWNGSQLVYGDGDGTQFSMLGNALDVGAHELTHAVTTYSANLTYSNESGALNEGTSDIMGASVEAWKDGAVSSDTWKVGEDVTTPGTAGDALRYMNNPTQDGSSTDYYPERYTGTGDNGGVHLNSGIANLAFKLMVTGGTHPRGKTTNTVTALSTTATTSINMGAKIWYRALTVYMNSSTNFAGARTATAQAATDLYGAAAAATVNSAWDAVGVGGAAPIVTLSNGVALTGQGASTGSWKHYKIAVPSSQTSLAIVMSGGTGDGDLYVKRGSQPTLTSYDYRPYLSGNNETVNVTNPVAGDWYISIYAYSTFASVSIKATYAGGGGGGCTSASGTLSGTGANSYQPSSSGYVSSVSGAHTAALTGPSGTDFDLYLQKWNGSSWAQVASSLGSTSTENINYSGTAGTYRWRVYSYTGSGTYNICTTKP